MLATRNMKLWLPFERNANDFSGNGNNGTVYGATLVDGGKFGKCYSFDAVDDRINYGVILDSVFAGSSAKFTISFYINMSSVTNNQQTILSRYSDSGTGLMERQFRIYRLDNELRFNFYTTPTSSNSYASYKAKLNGTTFTFAADKWYHIVLTFDATGATTLDKVKFYIDTVEYTANNYNTNGTPTYMQSVNNVPLVIGAFGYTSFNYFLGGKIDSLLIYDKLLSEYDIKRLYMNLHPLNG